jgi:hypothetical protein
VYIRAICSGLCLLYPGHVILDELALDQPAFEVVPAFLVEPVLDPKVVPAP